ncbi:MAG TPA: aminobenzoate oxygenase, partial [Methylomirabilota bacterium]|nr:aminobenzoate oxygenase [Methylomirabilota bacterium]
RFNQKELWENLGLPVKEAIEVAMASENMRLFRKRLFSRIVPTVKDIGLWGEKVQKAFADMGAIEFADVDTDALLEHDNRIAEDFDTGRFVRQALG